MARFFDLSAGELREFERVIGEEINAEDARILIKHADVRKSAFAAALKHPAFRRGDWIHGLYNSTDTVLRQTQEKLASIGYLTTDFTWIGCDDTAPTFTDDPEVVVVLNVSLADPGQTFEFLWQWAAEQQARPQRGMEFRSGENKLRLTKGKEFKPFTIEWMRLQLDANRGSLPSLLRKAVNPSDLAGIEIMAMAAQHPERAGLWVQRSAGLNLSAIELNIHGYAPWSETPALYTDHDDNTFRLTKACLCEHDHCHQKRSSPIILR